MSILLLGAGLGATQTRLLDYAPGAAAAYSLRQVGRQYNGPVVRVRRVSDNTERNFTASEINSGALVSWVNSTPAPPLDQASGAAAAYSLRNLSSSYSGNVIRVRRASDNDERDFTASEIIDGTLTTWTNATVALPLDQASGAAAAYSLRNLSASYTGDVVRVRRTSDNTESDFSADEITDGTLLSWVETTNTFYSPDFSIGVGGWYEPYPYGVLTYNVDTNADGAGIPPSNDWLKIECSAVGGRIYLTGNTALNSAIASLGGGDYKLEFDYYNPDSSFSFSNIYISSEPTQYWGLETLTTGSGSYSKTLTLTNAEATGITDFRFGSTNDASGRIFYIKNLKLTKADVNGHVVTWYDQSGNDRHATQATTGYQPQIVDSGVLVTEGGKAAVRFDGTDDFLLALTVDVPQPTHYFIVAKRDSLTNKQNYVDGQAARNEIALQAASDLRAFFAGAGVLSSIDGTTAHEQMSVLFSGASFAAHVNGSQVASGNAGTQGVDELVIGADSDQSDHLDGTISELIIYPTDQTANRTAIEANLAEFYGIDLPEGVDAANDEVDAFVTTWYDQSGNNRHATQATATAQPKIVSNGSLITENGKAALRFDGVNDGLIVSGYDVENGLLHLSRFAVVRKVGTQNGILSTTSDNGIGYRGGARFIDLVGNNISWTAGNSGFNVTSVNLSNAGYYLLMNGLHFVGSIYDGTQASVTDAITPYLDGSSPTPTSTTGGLISPLLTGGTRLHIGSNVSTNNFWNGNIVEYIIYPTDQSATREGIETNTALYYGIHTPLAYDVQSNEVNAYVSTWYDQSGNSLDATQATLASQPQIVRDGALITEGDKAAIEFDGSNDYLKTDTFTDVSQPYHVFILFSYLSDYVSTSRVVEFGDNSSRSGEILRQASDRLDFYAGNITWQLSPISEIQEYRLREILWNDSNTRFWQSSVPYYSSTNLGSNAANQITIANNRVFSNPSNISIKEMIFYPSDKTAQRQRAEGNIAWEYGLQDRLPWNHPYARSFPGFGSQRVPTDSDAIAYLTAVAEADGVGVEVPIANAIEDFILGCKSDGIWSSIKASCILAAARSLSGALVPLVGAAPTNLPVANGFAGGDYSRTAGLTGDGTSYLDSGRAGDDDPQNDRHRAMYVTVTPSLTSRAYMGHTNGTTQFDDIYHASNGFSYIRSLTSGPAYNGANETGFIGYSRASSATVDFEVFSSSATDWPHSSVTPLASNALVFGSNEPGGPGRFTDATIAFYSIGTSINLAQLDTRVSNLIASTNLYLDIGLNPDNYDQDTINYIYNAYKAGGSLA